MFCQFMNHFVEEVTQQDFNSVSAKIRTLEPDQLDNLLIRFKVMLEMVELEQDSRIRANKFLAAISKLESTE